MVVKYLRWKGVKIHQTFIDTWPSCLKIRSRQREGRRILVSGYKSNHPRSKGNCQCENPFPFPPTPISCHVSVVNNGCVFNESPAATRGPFNAPCISAWIHKCPPPSPPSLSVYHLSRDRLVSRINRRSNERPRTYTRTSNVWFTPMPMGNEDRRESKLHKYRGGVHYSWNHPFDSSRRLARRKRIRRRRRRRRCCVVKSRGKVKEKLEIEEKRERERVRSR